MSMGYGKIFESMFTGSMIGSGTTVFALWSYVIANAKPPGTVELNPKLLAAVFGCSSDDLTKAIDFLCSPDPESRTKEYEGRRLIREGQFLYSVPTWERYNSIRNEVERRQANREAQKRWRDRRKADRNGVSDDVSKVSQSKPALYSSEYASSSPSVGEESTRGEGDSTLRRRSTVDRPKDVSEEVWSDWIAHRRSKRASVTERVIATTRTRAAEAGMTLEQAMAYWVAQGHQGFFPPARSAKPAQRHSGFEAVDYGESGAI